MGGYFGYYGLNFGFEWFQPNISMMRSEDAFTFSGSQPRSGRTERTIWCNSTPSRSDTRHTPRGISCPQRSLVIPESASPWGLSAVCGLYRIIVNVCFNFFRPDICRGMNIVLCHLSGVGGRKFARLKGPDCRFNFETLASNGANVPLWPAPVGASLAPESVERASPWRQFHSEGAPLLLRESAPVSNIGAKLTPRFGEPRWQHDSNSTSDVHPLTLRVQPLWVPFCRLKFHSGLCALLQAASDLTLHSDHFAGNSQEIRIRIHIEYNGFGNLAPRHTGSECSQEQKN
ncbi:hypothetical protein FB451DRAFT_1195154 [Mycena latifolia]|nr:hypothetical protein FB451DRAFT_1195154 [Mycena latifolia]